ncbi:MAG: acyltransferase [Bacteroidia bacterium]|nr:acyltransferase [Bacteroidia bacterium]
MIKIGVGSELRPYCVIDGTKNVFIGNNVIVPENTRLITDPSDKNSTIIIEDSVLFAPNVSVYATTHTFNSTELPVKQQALKNSSTIIKSGAWLGVNVVIMPGVTVGKNAVIGANSVVTKDIPDYSVAVGAPAKVVKQLTNQNKI